MATTRERLKYYFRKYALPTEQQYAELIDAFVHKDEDTLTQEKIDGLATALAGKVATATYNSFVQEVRNFMDNNSGGEVTVDTALSDSSDNPISNSAVTEALASKADSSDLASKASASDLTALAARVTTVEGNIPSGSFLKQISDLDAYTDAQDGEIVQYIGQSNANYTRGFCYECKNTLKTFLHAGDQYNMVKILQIANANKMTKKIGTLHVYTVGASYGVYSLEPPAVGGCLYGPEKGSRTNYEIIDVKTEDGVLKAKAQNTYGSYYPVQEKDCDLYETIDGDRYFFDPDYDQVHAFVLDENGIPDRKYDATFYPSQNTASADVTTGEYGWQNIPVSPCVH